MQDGMAWRTMASLVTSPKYQYEETKEGVIPASRMQERQKQYYMFHNL